MCIRAGGAVSTPHWATNRLGNAGWLLSSNSDCHLPSRRGQQQSEMQSPCAPAPGPARGSRCPQWLRLRWRWQPRTLRGPGEPVHMLLWRGGAQRRAEDVLFKGQLPESTRESESSAPFPRPLLSLWVQAEWGGDAQVQVGILQPRSPQAELQAAEPGLQRLQPVQKSVARFLRAPRSFPSAVSGRGRALGVGDVVTKARGQWAPS